ncbi:MAG: YggT family protein [candidate division KSB1 bacterium]|nr:YggT family protein [candidate division KSB1 bacterium]MDZ7340267.1 YggT family protein [candidate division KSB1 bacterium]
MGALIHFVADAYIFIIIIRVILSWIDHNPSNPLIQLVYQITEPPLNWIRSMVPSLGGLDISPMILILVIYVLESILTRIF